LKQSVRNFCLTFLSCIFFYCSFCQINKSKNLFDEISDIDYNLSAPGDKKLEIFYSIKTKLENQKLTEDSSYVLVLLKISKYEFEARNDYQVSINIAKKALSLAIKLKKESLKKLTVNCYYNLASSYQKLGIYNQALDYYDTVLHLCTNNFVDTNYFQLDARYNKADIYFFTGDYQKAIDESIKGMNLSLIEKDSSYYVYFLNRKAQSLCYENYLKQALRDVNDAMLIARKLNYPFELATSYKTLGFIYEKEKALDSAEYFYKQSIKTRLLTDHYNQIASDYNDLGNFYLNSLTNFNKAQQCYTKMISFAYKDNDVVQRNLKLALANLNLGENSLLQNKYQQASQFLLESFTNLKINLQNDIKENSSSIQLSNVANKDLVIVLMNDKTDLLLAVYKSTHDISYLNACNETAIVTDSIITRIRHEHSGEQSKLYWRDKTRDFYTYAIEASYLANNPSLAFFFMEKSRAVLLNDKLNELGASAHLSATDIAKQEGYQIRIVELELKLSGLSDSSKQYQTVQLQLLDTKNNFEQFIKSLELKHPAYYQYKYADEVSSLQNLQQFLSKNNQGFVHYFMGDTVTYILAITATGSKLIRLSQKDFNKEELAQFLQLCANKQALNNYYSSFTQLSNSIYKKIFRTLQLPKGRIIICSDNIVIPFEALCTDTTGKHFLLNDYTFSYVYSARFLMKQFNGTTATGNFLGFAPVSFASYLDVNALKNAADALHASAVYYKKDKLFTYQNATKNNFFDYVSSYSIVSIFSHAKADTTDNEPVLYMQDSVIHLSELQLLNSPATKLVLLSACQTNVGKAATGEGIYSLARGFAVAGIPSVAATLWKADEQTIYTISEKFNKYLSEGMTKDEALQKAKLYFIQNNSNSEKLLPFYWANMIVIGNTDAIKLMQGSSSITIWHFIYFCIALILLFIFIYTKRKIMKRKEIKNQL